jgi:hypothetical protein
MNHIQLRMVKPYILGVLCGQPPNGLFPILNSFIFDIDGNDTITLLRL